MGERGGLTTQRALKGKEKKNNRKKHTPSELSKTSPPRHAYEQALFGFTFFL